MEVIEKWNDIGDDNHSSDNYTCVCGGGVFCLMHHLSGGINLICGFDLIGLVLKSYQNRSCCYIFVLKKKWNKCYVSRLRHKV